MIKLLINSLEEPLDSVWYHYRANSESSNFYLLLIPLTEHAIVKIIEMYAEVEIRDPYFERNILRKDQKKMSLGLIWNLFLFFRKNGYIEDVSKEPMVWTINNIKQVVVEEGYLQLSGDISD